MRRFLIGPLPTGIVMLALPLSLLLLSGLIRFNPFAGFTTTATQTQASLTSAVNSNAAVLNPAAGISGESVNGLGTPAVRATELSIDLRQALENTSEADASNQTALIPVTLHLPVQRMDFKAIPYRFQTSVAGPDEPVVYILNGQQITIDEFYTFQESLIQNQADRDAQAQINRQTLNARVTAALLPAFKEVSERDEIKRQLRINGGSLQTNLGRADIIRIADELAGSGIRLSLLHTNYSAEAKSSIDSAASQSNAETNLRNPLGAGLLIGFILCAYGLTFRSLSGMRMSA